MNRRNLKWTIWIFLPLVLVMAALILSTVLRRTAHIVLPETGAGTELVPGISFGESNALKVLEVTPETVQRVIATLHRPEEYRRTVTVEQFWEDGSGSYDAQVAVSGGLTRIDRMVSQNRVRHTITGEAESYVWYNEETRIYSAPAGEISADNEQTIPTYEDILTLSQESILAADYRLLSGISCIYVETAQDDLGYALRYWVSVDTGLLVSAEQLQNGEVVYRMKALTLDPSEPSARDFVLPDGRELIKTK